MICAPLAIAHSTAATHRSSSTRVSVSVYSVFASKYSASGATPTSRPGAFAARSDHTSVPWAISPCASPGWSRTTESP